MDRWCFIMINEIELGRPVAHYTAFYDGIWMLLDADDPIGQIDLCENFIDILYKFSDRTGAHFSEFSYCNVFNSLDIKVVSRNHIVSPCVFFKKAVDDGNVIMQCLDVYYIDKYKAYMCNHEIHDPFIYGYDTSTDEFLCADYYDYVYFRRDRISSSQMQAAVQSRHLNYDYMKGYLLLKKKAINSNSVNLGKIKRGLMTLLAPHHDGEYSHGTSFFADWIHEIEYDIAANMPNHMRTFTFACVHTHLMNFRLNYLNAHGFYIPEILMKQGIEIEREFKRIRNIILKYNMLDRTIEGYKKILDRLRLASEKYIAQIKDITICI